MRNLFFLERINKRQFYTIQFQSFGQRPFSIKLNKHEFFYILAVIILSFVYPECHNVTSINCNLLFYLLTGCSMYQTRRLHLALVMHRSTAAVFH